MKVEQVRYMAVIVTSDKGFQAFLAGRKSNTIRSGVRATFPCNPITLVTKAGDSCTVLCQEIDVKSLNQLTEEDAICNGHNSLAELLEDLREVYPELEQDDLVSVMQLLRI
jgi:hypothetical protein